MRRGPVPDLPFIGQPQELSRDDLERLKGDRGPSTNLPQRLRDSHHRIARLAATGIKSKEIALRVGYSQARVSALINSPAMVELIARYREKVEDAWVKAQDEYQELMVSNMLAAERHIADAIDDHDERGELLPITTALRISRDAADRMGYGKHQTNTNVNVDFAKALESAIARSRQSPRVIEGQATVIEATAEAPQPPSATPPRQQAMGPMSSSGSVGPIRRRA